MFPDLVLDLIYWYRWYFCINRCNKEYHNNYEELLPNQIYYIRHDGSGKGINFRNAHKDQNGLYFYSHICTIKTSTDCGPLSLNYYHAQLFHYEDQIPIENLIAKLYNPWFQDLSKVKKPK